jgi:hypothetical protein
MTTTNKETNVAQLPQNVGYSIKEGYTMEKSEYYRLLVAQGKKIEYTPNGIIIH